MGYRLADLLDIPRFQAILDSLDEVYSLPSAIIDIEGNILTATAWQDICTKFHRVNPQTEKLCIESDSRIFKELEKLPPHVIYKCPQGLVDTVTPIVIDGVHYGNAFTGQLFTDPPDEEWFRMQARKYGFDEKAYIDALRRVPVISEERLKQNLKILSGLTVMLARQGLQQKRQMEIEHRLKESEERYREFIEGTRDLVTQIDPEGNFTFVNHMAKRVFGSSPEELIGKSSFEFVHEDNREETEQQFRDSINRREQSAVFENRQVNRRTGETFYMQWKSNLHFDLDGGFLYANGIGRDITKLKHFEEELLEKNVLLETIIENSPLPILGMSTDGTMTHWNKAAETVFGWKAEEVIGRPNPIVPEEKNEEYRSLVIRAKEEGSYHSVEMVRRRKDGTPVTLMASSSCIYDANGRIMGFMAIFEDITEKKVAEMDLLRKARHIEKMLDAFPSFAVLMDSQRRILQMNKVARDLGGVIGGRCYETLAKLKSPCPWCRADIAVKNNEFQNIKTWGLGIYWDAYWIPIEEDLYLHFAFDLTAHKLQEEEKDRALREKEVLLREIHHRVKNNMAIINALLSLQLPYVKDLHAIGQFVETQNRIRAMALVHEKLYATEDFSKISFGDYVASLSDHIINTTGGDITLDLDIDPFELEPDTLIPCGLMINEVLTNSYRHAFDCSHNKRISLSAGRNADGNITMLIKDNGRGLPEGFDITKSGGLGLRLVDSLIKQLNGNLSVKNEGGASFRFEFPEKIRFAGRG